MFPIFSSFPIRFSDVQFNRTNELFFKPPQQETKPTPLPRGVGSAPSAPSINTLNKACHEVINDDYNYYKSATTLNISQSEADGLSDDDNEELDDVNISSDPHQRLIL